MSRFHPRVVCGTAALVVVSALVTVSCSSRPSEETSTGSSGIEAVTTASAQQAATTSSPETAPTTSVTTTTEVVLVVVPDLTGQTGAYARGVLDTLGLTLYVEESTEVLGEPDVILTQLPQPGTAVTLGSLVIVKVPAPEIRRPTLELSTAARQLLDETEDLKAGHAATIRAAKILKQDPEITHNPFAVIVKFEDNRTDDEISNSLTKIGGTRVGKPLGFDNLFLVETLAEPAEAVISLQAEDAVELAGLDYVIHTTQSTNDPFVNDQWGIVETPGVNAPGAWNTATGTSTVVVAVIDTGIQLDHPDLAANIWVNPGEIPGNGLDDDNNGYIDDINGWDFWNWDNNPDDDDIDGHGTHIAGIIGAVTNNGIGVAGIAPNVRLMALKVFNDDGLAYSNDFYTALEYALTNGAHVSNNSWGGYGENPGMEALIDAAGRVGHIFVAAAGNEETNTDITPQYPAAYLSDNIISVGALDQSGQMASFSNYGRTSVDVAAPGRDIYSTINNGGYGWMSGTSMAAPHVAGVVALLRSIEPNLIPSAIREILIDTSQPNSRLRNLTVSEGTVHAAAAVRAITQSLVPTTTVPTPTSAAPATTSLPTPTTAAPATTSLPTPTSAAPATTSPPITTTPCGPVGNVVGAYRVRTDRYNTNETPTDMAFDGTHIWVAHSTGFHVSKLRASDGALIGLYPAGAVIKYPTEVTFNGTHILVIHERQSIGGKWLSVLLPTDGSLVSMNPLNDPLGGMVSAGPHIWGRTGGRPSGAVEAFNMSGQKVIHRAVRDFTDLDYASPTDLLFDGENIWVTVSDNGYYESATVNDPRVRPRGNTGIPGTDVVLKLRATDGSVLGAYPVGESGGFGQWWNEPEGRHVGYAKDLAFDGTHIWVALRRDNTVVKLRASDGTILGTYPVGDTPYQIEFYGTDIWVRHEGGWASRLRVSDGTILDTYTVGSWLTKEWLFDGTYIWVSADESVSKLLAFNTPCGETPTTTTTSPPTPTTIACGDSGTLVDTYFIGNTRGWHWGAFDGAHIWAVNGTQTWDTVSKVRASDGVLIGTYTVDDWPKALTFDGTHIWVAHYTSGTVSKVRASDGALIGTYTVGPLQRDIAFDGTHIWILHETDFYPAAYFGDSVLSKLRASDGALIGTYTVGKTAQALTFDGTHIWFAEPGSDIVSKLRVSDGALIGTYPVGDRPEALLFDGAHIWVFSDREFNGAQVSKLRASDGALIATYPMDYRDAWAFDDTHIWVLYKTGGSLSGDNRLSKLRASDGALIATYPVDGSAGGLFFDGTYLWTGGSDPDNHQLVSKFLVSDSPC